MQLLLPKAMSRPLSTFRVLRNEDGPEEGMGRSVWRSRNPASDTLYVGNIPYSVEADEISELFKPYGNVQEVRVGASFLWVFMCNLF
jgi:RNA recognition motif-containing protein